MSRIKLPRLEKSDALALNRLYSSAPAVTSACSLTWVKRSTPFAERAWLEIEGDSRTAWLLFDSPAALGSLLKGPIGHIPDIDRVQAIEAYCTDLLDILEVSFAFALDVVNAGQGSRSALSQSMAVELPHSAASMLSAEFEWQADHMTVPVRSQLRMPYDWAHSFRQQHRLPGELRPGQLPVEISLQCGWTELTIKELMQLQSGSWVRLRHNYGTDEGWLRRLMVCASSSNWHIWADMIQASRLLVVPALAGVDGQNAHANTHDTYNTEMATAMNPSNPDDEEIAQTPLSGNNDVNTAIGGETDQGPDAPPASALAGLTLKVVFEVGTADIALDSMLELKPGYTIDLNRPIDPLGVRLLVNGGEVATGELTDIGGVLGVLVTSVRSRLLRA